MSIKANVKGKLGHARGTNSKILNPKSLLLLSRVHKWITNIREVMVDVIPVSEAYDCFAVQSCCLQERFKLRVLYNMLVILFI